MKRPLGRFVVAVGVLLFQALPLTTEAQNTAVPSSDELERRDQSVTDEDLRILQRADKILASAAAWNRHDTRVCNPTDRTWSLLCALDKASLEVLEEYRHREVAVQVDQVRRHQACSQSSDGSRCRAARGPEEEEIVPASCPRCCPRVYVS